MGSITRRSLFVCAAPLLGAALGLGLPLAALGSREWVALVRDLQPVGAPWIAGLLLLSLALVGVSLHAERRGRALPSLVWLLPLVASLSASLAARWRWQVLEGFGPGKLGEPFARFLGASALAGWRLVAPIALAGSFLGLGFVARRRSGAVPILVQLLLVLLLASAASETLCWALTRSVLRLAEGWTEANGPALGVALSRLAGAELALRGIDVLFLGVALAASRLAWRPSTRAWGLLSLALGVHLLAHRLVTEGTVLGARGCDEAPAQDLRLPRGGQPVCRCGGAPVIEIDARGRARQGRGWTQVGSPRFVELLRPGSELSFAVDGRLGGEALHALFDALADASIEPAFLLRSPPGLRSPERRALRDVPWLGRTIPRTHALDASFEPRAPEAPGEPVLLEVRRGRVEESGARGERSSSIAELSPFEPDAQLRVDLVLGDDATFADVIDVLARARDAQPRIRRAPRVRLCGSSAPFWTEAAARLGLGDPASLRVPLGWIEPADAERLRRGCVEPPVFESIGDVRRFLARFRSEDRPLRDGQLEIRIERDASGALYVDRGWIEAPDDEGVRTIERALHWLDGHVPGFADAPTSVALTPTFVFTPLGAGLAETGEAGALLVLPDGEGSLVCAAHPTRPPACLVVDEALGRAEPFELGPSDPVPRIVERGAGLDASLRVRRAAREGVLRISIGAGALRATFAPLALRAEAEPWYWPLAPPSHLGAEEPMSSRPASEAELALAVGLLRALPEGSLSISQLPSLTLVLITARERVLGGRVLRAGEPTRVLRATEVATPWLEPHSLIDLRGQGDHELLLRSTELVITNLWGDRHRFDRLRSLRLDPEGALTVRAFELAGDRYESFTEDEGGWGAHLRSVSSCGASCVVIGESTWWGAELRYGPFRLVGARHRSLAEQLRLAAAPDPDEPEIVPAAEEIEALRASLAARRIELLAP